MNKSVLVIDTPASCSECPLKRYSNLQMVCAPLNRDVEDVECPLKLMPQKKSHKKFSWNAESIEITNDYEEGWNACIEEILNETV